MKLSGLNLNLLVAFDAIMAERHLTRAAARLHLSQAALSSALGQLRHQLGDPLFVRGAHRLQPTARAEFLAPIVRRALGAIERMTTRSTRFDLARAQRKLVVAMSEIDELVLLPSLARTLTTKAPGIVLRSVPRDARSVDDVLSSGAADLVLAPLVAPDRRRHLCVYEQRFISLVRRHHPLAKARATPARLAAFGRILVAPHLRTDGGVAAETGHYINAALIACHTDHVVTMPSVLARALERIFPLHRLVVAGDRALTIGAFWHERDEDDDVHRYVRDQIAAVGRALAA